MSRASSKDQASSGVIDPGFLEVFTSAIPAAMASLRRRPDGTLCVPYANERLWELCGLHAKELIDDASPFFARVHPEDLSSVMEAIATSASRMSAAVMTFRVLHPTRGEVWLEARAVPKGEPEGGVIWHGFVTDVSARVSEERELRESRLRLQLALDSASIGTWELDLPTGKASWDERYYALYGLSPEHHLPSYAAWISAIHPDDRSACEEVMRRLLAGEPRIEHEFRVVRPDGSIRHLKGTGLLLRDAKRRPLRVLGLNYDVTERTTLAAALARSEAQFRGAIETSPVPYALNDEQGNVTYLNPEFVRTFGYKREDIPTLSEWWPRAYPDVEYRGWAQQEWARRLDVARREGKPFEAMELRIRCKDGTFRLVRAHAAALAPSFEGTHAVILYDITDMRQVEAERALLQQQLHHSQKMESVGRLAGGVAHDINNMLNVILGNVELAMRRAPVDDPVIAGLNDARDAGERAASLTRQLLTYARKQPSEKQVLSLRDVLPPTLDMLHRMLGEEITIELHADDDLWPVSIDPTQLQQVITNLCINASDAIEGHGKIVVSLRNVVASTYSASSGAVDEVMLEVSDTGAGMTPETKARLFEPFFTTKGVGKGTGLGLAVVHGIVTQHGGRVTADSTLGEGSVFRVFLPRHEGDARNEPSERPAAPKGGSETILVVEDEPSLLKLVTSLLSELGYRVLSAESPSAARRVAELETRPIDLLLTDISMPEMTGPELAKILASSRPSMRRLFMSGHVAGAEKASILQDFQGTLIEKPFTFSELAGKVRAALKRSS